MKKNISIVLFLLCMQLFAFYSKGHSQTGIDTLLIADETYLISNRAKTEAKIVCYNESVFRDLHKTYIQLFKRYTYAKKKDRHGDYPLYTIYLNKDDANYIVNWAKTNL